MSSIGYSPNVVVYTTLIDGCCKDGEVEKPKELFYKMEELGLVANQGRFSEGDIDRALLNLFSVQLRLGLFDGAPARNRSPNFGPRDVCSSEHKKLALEARAIPYNSTKFNEWVAEAKAPAVPGALRLYRTLLSLGFKIVFLSGTKEQFREVRIANLKAVGYHTWEKLILKEDADKGLTALAYKSKRRTELVNAGYRILGNSGDQWSDILGNNTGNRTFKIPDPMYYIG
ncbi:unnamed protein product [Fraxinus pennsylvanica]|uniref:Acid phosphatase n=1 Tax=Fraxinus pennsylvanica TaxID=56036 RepID=A0AAD2A6Z5_9LAMI|nr:unnamed protein product [Fraxinus pennsylvanica]